jgi:hypothetical protein
MNHLEYHIEYDLELLMVYVSGLTSDGFWDHVVDFDEVNDPESFAQGLAEGYKLNGKFATIESVLIEAVE